MCPEHQRIFLSTAIFISSINTQLQTFYNSGKNKSCLLLIFDKKSCDITVTDYIFSLPLPAPPFQHLGDVIADAFALAIVVFAVSISMAKILAKKNDYEVNANQVGFCHYWTLVICLKKLDHISQVTHSCLASHKWECDVWSGSTLFAYRNFYWK